MREQQYDNEIVPLLKQAVMRVQDLKGTLICFSEFEGNEVDGLMVGRVLKLTNPSPSALLVDMATRADGNIDALILGLKKAHNEGKADLSKTILLKLFEAHTKLYRSEWL